MNQVPGSKNELSVREFTRTICDNRTLRKLSELSKVTTGLHLVVLLRVNQEMVELCPPGGEEGLPPYCQVFRSTAEGRRRCLTCRSLVAFGACYRGLIEYSCHGGTTIIAAPAVRNDGTASECVVVAGCVFAARAHDRGWRASSDHGRDLGVDVRALKRAYYALPVYNEDGVHLAKAIVDAAATALGDIARPMDSISPCRHPDSPGSKALDQRSVPQLPALLTQVRDPEYRREGQPSGSALVDLVTAMVKRDPSMNYSVSNIARAACVTPNHFSSLFCKHVGRSFSEFLTAERMARACSLLSDPSLSIAEVARRSGFEDPAYFSRRFKLETGLPPTQWRNGPAAN